MGHRTVARTPQVTFRRQLKNVLRFQPDSADTVESMIPPRARWLTARRGVLRVVAVTGVLCAAGCTAQPPGSAASQTLRLGAQNTTEAGGVLTSLLVADPLFSIDWRGRPVPRLATEWFWKDDGRTLQIRLRPGVKFHDGTPVTGAVVAGILRQRAKNPRTQASEYVVSIENPDDQTVLVKLSRPDAFLIEGIAGTLIVDPDKPAVGTGPFKLLQQSPHIQAERNADYYRGRPGLDHVEIVTYETPRASWAALMRGEIDMVQEVNRDSLEFLEGASRFITYPSIRPFYIPLVFNLRHPILGRVEVRRALAEAINRDEILEQALHGRGQVADDPLWPFHWAYNAGARRHTYNPSAARLRLDAAGLPVRPPGERGRMPSRFRIQCLFWDSGHERIALLLQRQLAAIDVDLVLDPANGEELQNRAGSGKFELFLFQMTSGKSFDWTYRLWHSSGRDLKSGYSGADTALDHLRLARTDADVRAAVTDLRQRFYEDVPAAFLAWPEMTRAVEARFDVGDPSDPEILANLWRWRIGPTQRAAR